MKGLRCQTKEFTAYSIAASWRYCSKLEGFKERSDTSDLYFTRSCWLQLQGGGGHTGGQEIVRLGQGLGVMVAHECQRTRGTDSETVNLRVMRKDLSHIPRSE